MLVNNQEARRAAEKAYDVAKVDERVNRAVAAANAARVAAIEAVQKQMQRHRTNNNEGLPIPMVQNNFHHHMSTQL